MKPKPLQKSPCCKDADLNNNPFWAEKVRKPDVFGRHNPPRTGWAMSIDDITIVNVKFCPFCGKKLEDPQDSRFDYA